MRLNKYKIKNILSFLTFSIPDTTSQTEEFLRFYNWQLGKNSYVAFERDNYYKEGLWGTGFGQNGEWYMIDKSTINITMRVYGYGEDNSYTKEYFKEAIISGIDASGTFYMKDYENYWAPIMKQHQKLAK